MHHPAIPDWLTEGLASVPDRIVLTAHRGYRLCAVNVDQPFMVLPLTGSKRVALGPQQAEIGPGQFLMLHRAVCVQVENLPAAHQPYQAWVIVFPWRLVELARALLATHQAPVPAVDAAPFSEGELALLLPALRNLLDSLNAAAPDPALSDHALLGVLLALSRCGHAQFLRASDPSLSARIRLLVAAAPAREWSSADFEAQLHMSGATLRRRLAAESTSLRLLLREARLQHGLGMLQSTRRPLKAVAQACGYRSVPSFTRNFAALFGVEPTAVGHPPD